MGFIRHRSIRLMLSGLAIAALLVPVIGAVPASAATARPGITTKCYNTPVFFGLHGMNEGPSLNIAAISPELVSFDTDQNAISGAVGIYPVSYTTVYPNWFSVSTALIGALYNGENNLDASIKNYTKGCSASQDKIALVGYSMGAWVINKWIMDHPLERDMIKAVVLYGDPCWVNQGMGGADLGLVRRSSILRGFGCMPATDYPYPVRGGTATNLFQAKTYTMPNDPVSGADWGTKTFNAQFNAAKNCTNPNKCSHLDYTGSTEIYEGAQFVVSRLVG